MDRAAESARPEQREAPYVIEMRVRDDDGVEAEWVEGEWLSVAHRRGATALEHAEIDDDTGRGGLNEIPRSGHLSRRAAQPTSWMKSLRCSETKEPGRAMGYGPASTGLRKVFPLPPPRRSCRVVVS